MTGLVVMESQHFARRISIMSIKGNHICRFLVRENGMYVKIAQFI